jgi:hypothetical protein
VETRGIALPEPFVLFFPFPGRSGHTASGCHRCEIDQCRDIDVATSEPQLLGPDVSRNPDDNRVAGTLGYMAPEQFTMSSKRKPARKNAPMTFEQVRLLALALPKAENGTSYGTPAFKVRGKLFARLHQDGESLVVKIDPGERTMRMKADPETFYITDHYLNYPWVLVRISSVDPYDLRDLLEDAWRLSAPQRLVSQYDDGPA